jgi:hypothetical protein
MSEGFSEEKIEVAINKDEVKNLLKRYKKLKKYQKSSIFEIEKLSGKETRIDKLVNGYGANSESIE